jgi:hypothetical protein
MQDVEGKVAFIPGLVTSNIMDSRLRHEAEKGDNFGHAESVTPATGID